MSVVFDYDEAMGNPAAPDCLLSLEVDNNFFIATESALPWSEPADQPGDRMTLPCVFVESLVRRLKVVDPRQMAGMGSMEHVLSAPFLSQCISTLVDHLRLLAADDGDEDSVKDFRDFDELQAAADLAIAKLYSEEANRQHQPTVDANSWDAIDHVPHASPYTWVNSVTLEALVATTGTLEGYVDLCKILGPHAVQAQRDRVGGQLRIAVGDNGGQLVAVLKSYYMSAAQAAVAMPPAVMAYRVPAFLRDTQWPGPYQVEGEQLMDYLFDLSARASWHRANRGEWPALVHAKIVKAIRRLPRIATVMEDYADQPATLVREVQRLGDTVLKGELSQKLPFWRITEVESFLASNLGGLIDQSKAAGLSSTEIVDRIIEVLKVDSGQEKPEPGGVANEEAGGIMPPKRGQIVRALGEASFSELQAKFQPVLLEGGQPNKDSADLLSNCFAAKSVLPKAVLLASPGIRLTAYTYHSDFLALLQDERGSLRLYLGQCMAYDELTGEVPKSLKVFEFSEKEFEHLRRFEWSKLDPLNAAILEIKAAELGTRFRHHDPQKLYHDGDLIVHTSTIYGQLFKALGYPSQVSEDEGLTFEGFMARVKRMHSSTLAMTAKEARGMFRLIDGYVKEAYEAAGANAKRIIYSANLADRMLRAWLPEGEPVLAKLKHTITKLVDIQSFRVALPGIMGDEPEARSLPGFGREGDGQNDEERGYSRSKGRSGKRRPDEEHDSRAPNSQRAGAGGSQDTTSREERMKRNVKKVFYYDDGTFSIRTLLFDWPGICKKYNWDADALCGPVTMNLTAIRQNRSHTCMDPSHR